MFMRRKFICLIFAVLSNTMLYAQTSAPNAAKLIAEKLDKSVSKVKDSSYTLENIFPRIDIASIKITVLNDANMPTIASINLRNRRNELVYSHNTDIKGTASVFLGKAAGVKYLTVGWVGYERVYIPISKFKNIECDVIVRMKRAEMEIHPRKGTMH
jgi:uncharacterized membrane protein